MGHAEALYLQDVVRSTVSRETADQLAFENGTALMKSYQLDRFSDDLGFTERRPVEFPDLVDDVVRDLDNYGATVAERAVEETGTGYHARVGVQGPLYTGDRRSLCFLRVEVNRGSTASRVRNRRYTPLFPDVPTFELAVLDEAEILAEKIRAILTRDQPRDLYDVYHLLGKSVPIERELVQEKLDYSDLQYDPGRGVTAAEALEAGWPNLSALTHADPPAAVRGRTHRARAGPAGTGVIPSYTRARPGEPAAVSPAGAVDSRRPTQSGGDNLSELNGPLDLW